MQKSCPLDGVPLMEMVKNGVTIDVCPECKGVWLDRGELDKLISVAIEMEREYNAPRQPESRVQPPQPQYASTGYERRSDDRYEERRDGGGRSIKDSDEWHDSHDGRYPKKKKSTLGRIFDIFD
jgi:uncharacterized protein